MDVANYADDNTPYATVNHCVKSVQIRSFFRSEFSRIRPEQVFSPIAEKYGPEKTLFLATFHVVNDIDSLIFSLEEASKSSFTWFDSDFMRNNADKCQLLARSNEKVTTHSFPMHPFSTPENIRKPYDVFRGQRKGVLGRNVLKQAVITLLILNVGSFQVYILIENCHLIIIYQTFSKKKKKKKNKSKSSCANQRNIKLELI